MPETVGSHPAVFVTLTAPSFGAVHGGRLGCGAALSPTGSCWPWRFAPDCRRFFSRV
jgi:hypothetical protein